jgi:hypothetical protein
MNDTASSPEEMAYRDVVARSADTSPFSSVMFVSALI